MCVCVCILHIKTYNYMTNKLFTLFVSRTFLYFMLFIKYTLIILNGEKKKKKKNLCSPSPRHQNQNGNYPRIYHQ